MNGSDRRLLSLLGLLIVPSVVAALALLWILYEIVTLTYASDYTLFSVPVKSWFVLGIGGLFAFLTAAAFYVWYQLRRTTQAVSERRGWALVPLEGVPPVVYGHKYIDRPEYLSLIQVLFGHIVDAPYIQVSALPGGYGGSNTMLAQARRERKGAPLPRAFVVKLGDGGEIAGEEARFHNNVQYQLVRGAEIRGFAQWDELAGIAYEFVGIDPDHEIQSFHQFYRGHATLEVIELIGGIIAQLGRSWYQQGEAVPTDLYQEYDLLNRKQGQIIQHIGELVEQHDGYRHNFTVLEQKLQPNLKPAFCPEMDMPWCDPVAFLRLWPKRELMLPVHRSIVHGDLHGRNILIEVARDGQKYPWFIDFSHTGNGLSEVRTEEARQAGTLVDEKRGHTLRDFARLEADVKFILTPLQSEDDLRLAVALERELAGRGLDPDNLPATLPATQALADERFRKAWQVIREIRLQAAKYAIDRRDRRPYAMALLQATLPIVYYRPTQFADALCERQQKRYALIAAGILCDCI